uniref:Myb/SANT-like domain-containing protein n=1 Tax=Lactuca sativa TaxID=4236 RepID=A0A9R1XK69_LACSA|nr:hypothetical protein LSAT_V11C300144450 [Lactuca sativa]
MLASRWTGDAWCKAFTTNMSPKKDTEEGITWNNENTIKYCEVCIDYITKNGCGQLMTWREIEYLFTVKVGNQCIFKSWNPTIGKLHCSNEWWDTKLKEKPDAKKYRHKGVYPLLEEKWDHMFGDVVATGVGCVAPSLNPEFVNKSINDIDEIENENGY